jgi:YjbE family integral membrane protein
MFLFSGDFLLGLFSVVMIDLVLAGDNAIVIGMAARNVPSQQRRKAILLGMGGAVLVRMAATAGVVWLLQIPGLLLAGGILLIWIAYKLLADDQDNRHEIDAKDSLIAAVRTIVVADAVMGIDNVLGIAGAAHGDLLLVVMGLLISVPIIVWGSTFFITCVEKFPIVIYIGSGILAWTAAKMIVGEPLVATWFDPSLVTQWIIMAAAVAGVLGSGWLKNRPVLIPIRIQDRNHGE